MDAYHDQNRHDQNPSEKNVEDVVNAIEEMANFDYDSTS